jgi:hypothetical protein
MNKGIIYLLKASIKGVVKIGKTTKENYKERIRNLESNGYSNFNGLKQEFAIELNDYDDKEKLLHELFGKQRIAQTEFFAIDIDLLKQLMLAMNGKVIFPKELSEQAKEEEFEDVTKRRQGELFDFYKKGLKNGDKIVFVMDDTKIATISSNRDVLWNNKKWKLSPLTRRFCELMNKANASGAYQGL